MAVYVHNLTINQGSDFDMTFDIEGGVSGDPLDLTGYSASAQLRKSHSSSTAVSFAATTGVDASFGEVKVSLAATVTANLKPGRYVYDVLVSNPAETVRVVEGTALVRSGVTR